MVIENIMSSCASHVRPYFYRSSQGAEIDLILETGGGKPWAIEIKRSSAPAVSHGFHIACKDIGAEKQFVVYAGPDQFSISDRITALPLGTMMELVKAL